MKKRISFPKVCYHITKNYGPCMVGRLKTKGGNIVPKCYVGYYENPIIFTTDEEIAKRKCYVFINVA